jgi:hypothetical protein
MKKLKIKYDSHPENPRKMCDMLGVIAYKHSRYLLGEESISEPIEWLEEKLNINPQNIYSDERLEYLEEKFFSKYIALPLYLYDHSGITMKTTPFSCRWDSGKVGYIYVTKEKVKDEYSCKIISAKRRKIVEDYLRGEVDVFDLYLRGECFGFVIEGEDGEEEDSCGGFYGRNWETNGLKDYIPEELWPQLENIEVEY